MTRIRLPESLEVYFLLSAMAELEVADWEGYMYLDLSQDC